MEDSPSPTTAADNWADQFAEALGRERARVEEFLAAEREQFEHTEARLAEQVQQMGAELARGREKTLEGEEDYQRRYEMALEDLRELKHRNAELEEQLAEVRSAGASVGSTLDWESEKRRILAVLEAENDEEEQPDEQAAAGRIKIEEVVRATDEALAEKDRQIARFRQLLEGQGDSVDKAVDAATLEKMLDKDALVAQEREKLGQLQEEWREKIRQAEIEISIERAKIAREKAAVEEKLRALANGMGVQPDSHPPNDQPESVHGRWLARLGLGGQKKG